MGDCLIYKSEISLLKLCASFKMETSFYLRVPALNCHNTNRKAAFANALYKCFKYSNTA